jgi:hypothetical protein
VVFSQYDCETDITTQLTLSSNKSLRSTAHVSNDRQADQGQRLEQASKSIKAANIATSYQENDPKDQREIALDDRASSDWSQNQYRASATEEEEVEAGKQSKAVPYQLQQWMFETSNPKITFAERLEKSKWNCEDAGTEECLNVEESCGSWGRKPYDWILFDE